LGAADNAATLYLQRGM